MPVIPVLDALLAGVVLSFVPAGSLAPAAEPAPATLRETQLRETQHDDEEAVADTFRRYREALIAGDGAAAQRLVDAATLDTFERLRGLALRGREEEIQELSFVERLLVVSMRHALDPERVATMELADLIETAMGEGWISTQTLAQLDIGAITVEGDVARAEAKSGLAPPADPQSAEAEVELEYRFVREDGEWKFQFASLVETLDRLVAELMATLGTDEDQLIFMLVESFTGRKVLPDVWQPPPAGGEGPP